MNCNDVIVSIIVPVYNAENKIARTVSCIQKQTETSIEIILVNDGSTDHSGEICRSLMSHDPRINYIEQPNAGAGAARNAGIRAARGKYILFVDADDQISDRLVEITVAAAERIQADIVVFSLERIIHNSKTGVCISRRTTTQASRQILSRDAFRSSFFELYYSGILFGGPVNKLFRRDVIVSNAIAFPNLRRGQDEIFNFRYYPFVSSMVVIPDTLYTYYAYDEAERMVKYKPDYYISTMIPYYTTLFELVKEFGINEKEKADVSKSFVYSLDNGISLCWNPTVKLTKSEKIDHIKRIISHDLVVQVLPKLEVIPHEHAKLVEYAIAQDDRRIYRKYSLLDIKKRLRGRLK